jgi:hypothetical protein
MTIVHLAWAGVALRSNTVARDAIFAACVMRDA